MTTMMGVPATYLFMANEPAFASADLSSLRLAVVGGAPMPEALLETWQRRGVEHRPGLRPDRGGAERALPAARGRRRKAGYAGKPYPYVDVRLSRRGRAARARAERLPRLLAQPRGDRGAFTRRLAAHRRHRRARRRGRLPDPRPAQGHGHLRRRERLPGRGRGGAARASRGASRRPSSACPTSAGARSASPSSSCATTATRGRSCVEHCRGAARALQGAEGDPLRRRAAAQRAWTRC